MKEKGVRRLNACENRTDLYIFSFVCYSLIVLFSLQKDKQHMQSNNNNNKHKTVKHTRKKKKRERSFYIQPSPMRETTIN